MAHLLSHRSCQGTSSVSYIDRSVSPASLLPVCVVILSLSHVLVVSFDQQGFRELSQALARRDNVPIKSKPEDTYKRRL